MSMLSMKFELSMKYELSMSVSIVICVRLSKRRLNDKGPQVYQVVSTSPSMQLVTRCDELHSGGGQDASFTSRYK
jgi:hypothetical protein